MELLKTIKDRRSIRNFKNDNIDYNLIKDILNCGRLAPSAKNRQPWYLVVVTGDTKNQISDMMIDYEKKKRNYNSRERYGFNSSINTSAKAIRQAPVLILIFRKRNDYWLVGDNLSIGACVQNMCLRATDLGLGSLWIRDICDASEDIAAMIGHGDMELNCALAIGYSEKTPQQRPRKQLKDIVEWYNK